MTRLSTTAGILAVFVAACCVSVPLGAQVLPGVGAAPEPAEAPANGEAAPPGPKVDPELKRMLANPRQTMRSFMQAVEANDLDRAARALDLSGVSNERAGNLAAQLKRVIDRMSRGSTLDIPLIPSDPNYEEPWRLSELDGITGIVRPGQTHDAELIELVKGEDGLWRFSASTVKQIEALHARWRNRGQLNGEERAAEVQTFSMWLEDQFQPHLRDTNFLLPDYQWICLFVVILLGLFADRLVRGVLSYATNLWIKYVVRQPTLSVHRKLWRPVGWLVQALVWYSGLRLLLPNWPPLVDTIIFVAIKLFGIVAAVWTTFIFINLLGTFLAKKAAKTPTKFDDLLVPLVTKSMKILAVCLGAISVAQVFDWPLAGVLAGLGIGGLALGLAAQDTIKNFFGSVMIFTDRPFELGDRVVIDGHDGPVETVGFRSTRIRTLEGNLVTIPNGELANKTILNIGKRPNIRRIMNLTITYDTPREKVQRAVEIVREILAGHEGMDPEFPPRVFFNEFNADSLNIWVIFWYHPADWWAFSEFSERVNFEILRRYEEEGIEFAFPTQTLYLAGDPKRPLPPFAADLARNGEPAEAAR